MPKVTTAQFGDVAILPFQVVPPVRQSFKWVTDVFESQNGTESVLQLRETPRESFSLTMPEKAATKARGFIAQYGAIAGAWALPIWHEQQYVGFVADGNSTLVCDTSSHDFRDASLALLIKDADTFQILEIDSVGDDILNLSNETVEMQRAYVMPLRVGRIVGSFERQSSGYDVVTDFAFETSETLLLTPDAPTQFLGDDIYFMPPMMDGQRMSFTVSRRIDVSDYEIGPVSTRSPWLNSRVARPHSVVCVTLAETLAFKNWLFRRAGKFRRYWEPSFEHDMRLASVGAINSTILVKRDDFTVWPRLHVAFELDDGTWLARVISNFEDIDPTTTQVNLAVSLGGVDASRIRRISWLGLKRLDADLVELNWIGNGVMKSSIATVELQP